MITVMLNQTDAYFRKRILIVMGFLYAEISKKMRLTAISINRCVYCIVFQSLI
jgi:hypothetical protein